MTAKFRYIYCDMDQVLVNFLGGARIVLGREFNDPTLGDNDTKWPLIAAVPSFWPNLPWMPGAQELWNRIKPFNPYVLTACPRLDPSAHVGKLDWCRSNLDNSDRCITVDYREDKIFFAKSDTNEPNLLIDDHPKTIAEWIDAGGIGILHYTIPETMRQLDLYL